jgi:hypothetical protein
MGDRLRIICRVQRVIIINHCVGGITTARCTTNVYEGVILSNYSPKRKRTMGIHKDRTVIISCYLCSLINVLLVVGRGNNHQRKII